MSFVLVPDTFPPQYSQVPESQKWPRGPYQQAPAQYGGNWWKIGLGPFGGSATPWTIHVKPKEPTFPEGFIETFGPRPQAKDYVGMAPLAYQTAMDLWEQDLQHFKQAGIPDFLTAEQVGMAADIYNYWDMGSPRLYEGRYGWRVRWPQSQLRNFDADALTAIATWPHGVVARYQIALVDQLGVKPREWSPWVPGHARGEQ